MPLESMFDTLRLYNALAQLAPFILLLAVTLWLRRRAAKSVAARSTAAEIYGAHGL